MSPRQICLSVWLALASCVFIAAGCNQNKPTGGGDAKKLRIAVIPKGTGHEFWKSVEAGARKAEKELDVQIVFKGPTGEGATADQIQVVENFLDDGYDGICLAPLDAMALRKPVDKALNQKTPVVIFDSGLTDMNGVTSFVATNNERGGERAGEYLAGELLQGKGKVILMRYQKLSASTDAREEGFVKALKKYKDIELISDNQYGGPDEAKGLEVGEQLLLNFSSQVDGIFCPNESSASGMLTALEKHPDHLAGKVKFVGFDSSDNLVRGLKAGHVQALIVQDPFQMGYDAVKACVEKLRGKSPPERIEVPETLATTENMSQPKIDKILHPLKADGK